MFLITLDYIAFQAILPLVMFLKLKIVEHILVL